TLQAGRARHRGRNRNQADAGRASRPGEECWRGEGTGGGDRGIAADWVVKTRSPAALGRAFLAMLTLSRFALPSAPRPCSACPGDCAGRSQSCWRLLSVDHLAEDGV